MKKEKNLINKAWLWAVTILMLFVLPPIGIIMIFLWIGLYVYAGKYFKSQAFMELKNGISSYIDDCNQLNEHMEELRSSYINAQKTDYGESSFDNISNYNYKKKHLNIKYAPNIYDCSRTVCANAQKQPFKYICKYFNIKADEETLNKFEEVLNNFSAAEEGKELLRNKKNLILASIEDKTPKLIQVFFAVDLEKNLGFEEIEFNSLYYPEFVFRYVSSGGNSGTQFTTTMDIPMLERFIAYLDENIKKRKSAAGQRALMTPKLRTYIKERDNYTCKCCGNSTDNEPNLLLEIDHIIPIAKGGLTEVDNLQTLCWKCNRSKGAKVLQTAYIRIMLNSKI